jgi:hypothetical protein
LTLLLPRAARRGCASTFPHTFNDSGPAEDCLDLYQVDETKDIALALRGKQWLPRSRNIEVEVQPAQLRGGSGFAGALHLSQSLRRSLLDATGEPDRSDESLSIPRPRVAARA